MPERKTLQIVNDITSKVRQYPRFTIFDDVNVRVENGVAMLTGAVTMGFKREDIGKLVSRTWPAWRRSNNQLTVLPMSPFDDELRSADRAGHLRQRELLELRRDAQPADSHRRGQNGRVTLTGVVQNNVDRMLARSLATNFGAFDVKNELKTDAEMKDLLEKI